ncbi:MAG: hypothetical protein Q4E61_04445 [Alphaproteobacteria bacterium]|nr:hypothetical protein [Alphaproteobacteria bacterium]
MLKKLVASETRVTNAQTISPIIEDNIIVNMSIALTFLFNLNFLIQNLINGSINCANIKAIKKGI